MQIIKNTRFFVKNMPARVSRRALSVSVKNHKIARPNLYGTDKNPGFFLLPAAKTAICGRQARLRQKQRKKLRISGKHPDWTLSVFLIN